MSEEPSKQYQLSDRGVDLATKKRMYLKVDVDIGKWLKGTQGVRDDLRCWDRDPQLNTYYWGIAITGRIIALSCWNTYSATSTKVGFTIATIATMTSINLCWQALFCRDADTANTRDTIIYVGFDNEISTVMISGPQNLAIGYFKVLNLHTIEQSHHETWYATWV